MKKTIILYAFLFVISIYSVGAQTNPFLSAQITGPDTFRHSSIGCYELPYVSGASYHWNYDSGLHVYCGNSSIYHVGFTSSHNTAAGGEWKWESIKGHLIKVWDYCDGIPTVQNPPVDEDYTISCAVVYNGQTYWFTKYIHVQGV